MGRFVEGSGQNRENSEGDEQKEKIPESLIGLSLSMCIQDILKGKVTEEEVKEIISGTNYESEDGSEEGLKKAFLKVIEGYAENYWAKGKKEERADNAKKGVEIAKRFFDAGKINQARAEEGGEAFDIKDGRWVEVDKFDEYKKSQDSTLEDRSLRE